MTEGASFPTTTPAQPELSVSFHNFYSGFAPAESALVRELSTRFRVTVEAVGRDVQFSGVFGSARLPTDCNPAAFINARDFATLDDLVRHVLWLDDTPSALADVAGAPPFVNNEVRYEHTPAYAVDRIEQLLGAGGSARMPERWIVK